jgi:hypothetical protein
VEEETSYGAELWLNGVPLPTRLLNKLLGVAAPNVPEGSFDYTREGDIWLFRSLKDLSETERASVATATAIRIPTERAPPMAGGSVAGVVRRRGPNLQALRMWFGGFLFHITRSRES